MLTLNISFYVFFFFIWSLSVNYLHREQVLLNGLFLQRSFIHLLMLPMLGPQIRRPRTRKNMQKLSCIIIYNNFSLTTALVHHNLEKLFTVQICSPESFLLNQSFFFLTIFGA